MDLLRMCVCVCPLFTFIPINQNPKLNKFRRVFLSVFFSSSVDVFFILILFSVSFTLLAQFHYFISHFRHFFFIHSFLYVCECIVLQLTTHIILLHIAYKQQQIKDNENCILFSSPYLLLFLR